MTRRRRIAALTLASILAAAGGASPEGAANSPTLSALELDSAFGAGGRVEAVRAGDLRLDTIEQVEIDSKGRIVVAGWSLLPSVSWPRTDFDGKPALARFRPDGTLDASFGAGGVVVLPVLGGVHGLALDALDRPIVCGGFLDPAAPIESYGSVRWWMARVTENGALDASFSGYGLVESIPDAAITPTGVRVSPLDGSICALALGYDDVDRGTASVLRVTADGAVDRSYAGDGFAEIDAPARGLAFDASGRALVAGFSGVVRLRPDGTRDVGFATGVPPNAPNGYPVRVRQVEIDGQGRVVAQDGVRRFLRYDAIGAPDATFGDQGLLAATDAVPVDASVAAGTFAIVPGAGARVVVAADSEWPRRPDDEDPRSEAFLQLVDFERPQALASWVRRPAGDATTTHVADVAVSADGSAAYVVGTRDTVGGASPFVARVDLAHAAPRPTADVSVRWRGPPRAVLGNGGLGFRGRIRVTRRGGDFFARTAEIWLSDDDRLDASDRRLGTVELPPFRRAASREATLPDFDEGVDPVELDVAGRRLLAVVDADRAFPETDYANDVAVSTRLANPPGWKRPLHTAVVNEVFQSTRDRVDADGAASTTDDQFVEIVNVTDAALDVSGWTIAVDRRKRFVFPAGTSLPPRAGAVVFGGGDVSRFAPTGGAAVFSAAPRGLGVGGPRFSLELRDAAGAVVDAWRHVGDPDSGFEAAGFSWTRGRDADPTAPFRLHPWNPSRSGWSSPGTRHNGDDLPPPPDPGEVPSVTMKVLVLDFDPVVESQGGKRLHEVYGWTDPHALVAGYLADLENASGGYVDWQVVDWVDADDYLVKTDGFIYTDETFAAAWSTRTLHQPNDVDYDRLVADYGLAARVKSGEIDEVVMYGYPYAGYYESRMAGPGAYWCNSPGMPWVDSGRKFVMMGLNYERGVGEALESFGHRVESILTHVYGSWNGWPAEHDWDRFTLHDKIAPGHAACGNVHYAPNSASDYDWGNPRVVTSTCDDWLLNWPNLVGATKEVDRAEWGGGDIRAHHAWWLSHLPKKPGVHADGKRNNWWKYVADFNRYAESR